VTPQGPPRAVKVTLTLEFPAARTGQPPTTRTATQVIAIRAAPGTFTPTLLDPYTQGTTTEDPAATTDPATGGTTTTPSTTGSAPAATSAPATTSSAPAASGGGGATTSKGGR
jgi:hypothetical protein